MSSSLVATNKEIAKKKGTYAAVAFGGAVVLGVMNAPILATGAAAAGAYLTWKWFVFRAKNGMRF